MDDPFDLQRFIEAQALAAGRVRAELAAGRKASHWMWFVFPQLAGLGSSPMARRYAIASEAEATAYLAEPTLGPQLREFTALVCDVRGRSAHEIFGSPDDLKFHSSMTLFDRVAPGDVFAQAIDLYFHGGGDPATLEKLGRL